MAEVISPAEVRLVLACSGQSKDSDSHHHVLGVILSSWTQVVTKHAHVAWSPVLGQQGVELPGRGGVILQPAGWVQLTVPCTHDNSNGMGYRKL